LNFRIVASAIVGLPRLLIRAVEMLPLGSSDGDRISHAIFGRSGYLFLGVTTWFALMLVATVFVHQSRDILLGPRALNNRYGNPMPRRSDPGSATPFRSAARFLLFGVALLAILPMQ
jgi:hypothetical protein